MIPRAQGLRSCGRSFPITRKPTAAVSGSRNYSAVSLHSHRHAARQLRAQPFTSIYAAHQCRSISWTGWWSGKPATPSEALPSSYDGSSSLQEPAPLVIKASRATADTPDPSLASVLTAEPHKPEILESVQDKILAPQDGPWEVDPTKVVEHVGFMKNDLGLDFGWGPSTTVQWVLEHLHITCGLSWGLSIVALGVIIRLFLLKPILDSQNMTVKMKEVAPILAPLREQYKAANEAGNRKEVMRLAAEMRTVNKAIGAKPLKMFLPILIQVPLGFGGFRVLRNAAELPVESFQNEGFLWFPDLCMTDPWLLPLLTAAITYRSISRNQQIQAKTAQNINLLNAMKYGFPVVSFIFSHYQPLAVQIWFLTSSFLASTQSELFANERARRVLGLPPIPETTSITQEPVKAFGYQYTPGSVDLNGLPTNKPVEAEVRKVSVIDKAVDKVKGTFSATETGKLYRERQQKQTKKTATMSRRKDEVQYERQVRQEREMDRHKR